MEFAQMTNENLQLVLLMNSFQFYQAWQPSSFESLDEGYCENTCHAMRESYGNVLVVKDLPVNLDNDGLKDFFSLFGAVTDTSSSRGVGFVTFEEGSSGAIKVMEAQPIKIFGKMVQVQLAANSGARQGHEQSRRNGPFPVVVAPPNFGPLPMGRAAAKKLHKSQEMDEPTGNAKENMGMIDKATQTLASAATKFQSIAQNQRQDNGLLCSAPPALAQPQQKASIHSLLSSSSGDPLFDDDDGGHFVGESPQVSYQNTPRYGLPKDGRQKHGGPREILNKHKATYFHSDNTLMSWVWYTGQKHSSLSRPEADLSCVLVRGRAVNANLPLLASTSSTTLSTLAHDDQRNKNQHWCKGTNLNLLHKAIDVAIRKNTKSPYAESGGKVMDKHENPDTCMPSRSGHFRLYQTRHPSLAPLISVTKCAYKTDCDQMISSEHNGDEKVFESIMSVFDISPSRHRPLHELLRSDDFLTQPLFPGIEGHELEPLADDFVVPHVVQGSPMAWFGGNEDENDGLCRCHKPPEWGESWGADHKHTSGNGGVVHSSPKPNLILDGIHDKEDLHPTRFFGELGLNLRKFHEGAQPAPKYRRRSPWKMFEVGSAYRANVADLRIRFLALQLFHAVNFCHSKGVTLGEQLYPDKIFIQDDGWMRLALPITQWEPESVIQTERKINHFQASIDMPTHNWRSIFRPNDGSSRTKDCPEIIPYPGYGDVPMVQWQRGQLTNLCYLMMLNSASGRSVGDHTNPPIFPWVTDFSEEIDAEAESRSWRDLSKSKFRLNKGDEQLDKTYCDMSHHVPENICELTVSVYRARCLPIHHLQATVRGDFIAAHYPSSIQSLYEWTPDEATIEFYMHAQPSIFCSMHSEMEDLALPSWCNKSDSFIAYHRRLLESEYVSCRLHLWIDLNFGEALTGKRAIMEKNVVIAAVPWANGGCRDKCFGICHSVFTGSPVREKQLATSKLSKSQPQFVQLFVAPHPQKQVGHMKMMQTVSLALRTAFNQAEKDSAEGVNKIGQQNFGDVAGFEARKQRDRSTIGAILKDCYCSARVIPPPAVDETISKLLMGTLDLRQSLKNDNLSLFPQQLKDTYQVLSSSQNLTFERSSSESDFVDGNEYSNRSTSLERVWRLIKNQQSLESLSSVCVGLVLQSMLSPLNCITPFIENCTQAHYSSYTDRLCNFLILLSTKLTSADLIVPLLFNFMGEVLDYAANDMHKGAIITEELGKLLLSRSLIHSLSSSSCGESFIAQATSFVTKQLCTRLIPSNSGSLHTLFIKLLHQDKVLGSSLCCKYIVPSLMQNIKRASTINNENSIVHALESLVPYLPPESIGVLLCKPILRTIIPLQLSEGQWEMHDKSARHLPDMSTTPKLGLLKDLTILLQSCLRRLSPKTIVKYYFRSNNDVILQLLTTSFEAMLSTDGNCGKNERDNDPRTNGCCTSKDVLKQACNLVCDAIDRVQTCQLSQVSKIIEKFCSQVNDCYVSITLHQKLTEHGNMSLLSKPGVEDALLIANKAMDAFGREKLELLCPSALEFLAWTNPARVICHKPNFSSDVSPLGPADSEEHWPESALHQDTMHEVVGGSGMSLEMRAPKRQPRHQSSSIIKYGKKPTESRDSLLINGNGSIAPGLDKIEPAHGDEEEHCNSKQELVQDLVWLLGLHREEREENIRYLWQPRMMLATKLECNQDDIEAAITSMDANLSETQLVIGNEQGQVLLFDLRQYPPVLTQKQQFDNSKPIKKVDFFDNRGNILVCNGGLHLYNAETQAVPSTLSPENTFHRNCREVCTSWKGDHFVNFSLFPKATGLGEIMGDATGEFASISSSYCYTIDTRCSDSVVDYHKLIRPDQTYINRKKSKFDPMFRTLTWNTAPALPEEELRKNPISYQTEDGKVSFNLISVTAHADWICAGSSSGHIHCYDRRQGRLLKCWKSHSKAVEYLKAISRHMLLSVGGDKMAVLWDMSKTPPHKITSIYNIPGKENAMNITSNMMCDESLVSIPEDGQLLLCAAAGRKAVFMAMPQVAQRDDQLADLPASRMVMSDFEGNRIPSSGKLNISSVSLLPCRQLVLLGCQGSVHVCI